MTQRITWAILISACSMLLLGGVAAYFAVRSAMLAELDERLIERATAAVTGVTGLSATSQPSVPPGDRFLIRTDRGQTIGWVPADSIPASPPTVMHSGFVKITGEGWARTMTLRWDAPGQSEPLTIVYRTPSRAFDSAMLRLAATLSAVSTLGVALTAVIARRVSRAATQPMLATAAMIGQIDERNLARRIDSTAMPLELRPIAVRLNEMLTRLEESFDQRRQFMLDAAHEIRSPVAALRATLEVARDTRKFDASATVVLDRCLTVAGQLESLGRCLAECVDAPASVFGEHPEPVRVGQLVAECVEMFQSDAQRRGIEIRHPDSAGDQSMLTILHRIRSIVVNLVSNAIEHTPPGGVVVVREWWAEGRWFLSVRDTGVGIPKDFHRKIFEPFTRLDEARRRDRGHLGLGLFLVKTHVERLRGQITLQSEPGVGSEFIVSVPGTGSDESSPGNGKSPDREAVPSPVSW